MKTTCIIPAAGRGNRLGCGKDKAFVALGGKPLLSRTIGALEKSELIDDIVVVVSRGNLTACRRLVKKYAFSKVHAIVKGGKKRFDSVKTGLQKAKDADFIVIHDGARPFVDAALIKTVLAAAKRFGGALSAIPSKQTIKRVNKRFFIQNTPRRKFLWEAQTPQAFKRKLILAAYNKARDKRSTDDSSLVEELGYRIKVVKGPCSNIKITTPEDLVLAEMLIKKKKK